jgi:DNA topoisomerase-2
LLHRFVNKELILFSMADNIRSIPSVVDGFKPSQRKVLFCCFKRNLKVELKVAQLGGYVSEHSAYHHGEQSLYGTIVNMAQDFVGSNNVHLLSPNGQFGTRLMGGKDAASPRYIFTNLEKVTRLIFDARDNDVLKYLDEDGQSIEPEWYIPVIPMALVNGSDGIGTGWSSSVPNYNPYDIINILRQKIKQEATSPLIPWYRGFIGHIVPKPSSKGGSDSQNFLAQGLYEVTDENTLVITELPVKTWTQTYKQFLEVLLESGAIKDFKENHTDTKVLFTISMEEKKLRDITNAPGGIVKKFKLETSLSTSNMHLFDAHGHIKKYESPEEILDEFYGIRIDYYHRRKRAILRNLSDQIKLLSNKTRFVLSVVEGKLIVNNRKKQDLMKELLEEGYDQILPQSGKPKSTNNGNTSEDDEGDDNIGDVTRGYDYLLSMRIWSLTKERVESLRAELQNREQEYQTLEAKTVEDLWLADLDVLEAALRATEEARERVMSRTPTAKKNGKGRKPAAKRKKRTKKGSDDDDDDDSDFEMEKPKPKKPRTPSKPRAKPAAKPAAIKEESVASNKGSAATKEPTSVKESTAAKSGPTATKKKTTAKADAKKKATTITSFFGAKKEPESDAQDKGSDSDSDVEVLSLAERLARRAKETPQKKPKVPVQASTVDLADSDNEDKLNGSAAVDDEDDVFAMDVDDDEPKPKKVASKVKAPAQAKAPGKAKAKASPKKTPAPRSKSAKAAKSALELDDEDEEDGDAPTPAKAKGIGELC